MNVGIIDYGLGNMLSVAGAVRRLGVTAAITRDFGELRAADLLILPGVGAFGDGMANLKLYGLIDVINELVIDKCIPILGICLGAQLMTRESYEFGHFRGLGWVPASVIRLKSDEVNLRIPHVGWDEVLQTGNGKRLFRSVPGDALFYYVHSYWFQFDNDSYVTSWCNYGQKFTGSYEVGHIVGVQFHPEKSQKHGLTVLKNFIGLD